MNKLNWSAEGTTITQEQLDEWLALYPRAGEVIESKMRPDSHYGFRAKQEFKRVGWAEDLAKDGQKKPIYPLKIALCPCKVCGHTYMLECEIAGCDCCSEPCT